MIFHNASNCAVFLHVQSSKIKLEPHENVTIDIANKVIVTLTHDYNSSAISKKEIAFDNMDDSLVSLIIAPHKKAYFNIVLDCVYEIQGSTNSEIYIKQEMIRPVYACSYDRLYPSINDGSIKEVSYTFSEREKFEEHYLSAISSNNQKIVVILTLILFLLSLPIVILTFLANIILGGVATVVIVLGLLLIYFFGLLVVKLICKADCLAIFSNFESLKIIEYFRKSRDVSVS